MERYCEMQLAEPVKGQHPQGNLQSNLYTVMPLRGGSHGNSEHHHPDGGGLPSSARELCVRLPGGRTPVYHS
jgi:hypothetical protein